MRQVNFENGFVDRGSLRGGVFATEDEELQKGIESHPRFKTGFCDEIWTDDVEKNVASVKEGPKAEEPLNGASENVYPEVTKMAEVRTILKEKYGKTAAEIKSNAQVKALIDELGLVFPNLK